MTHRNFTDKYGGKYIDFDGIYGHQCVDLMRHYIKEVKGWNPYEAIPTTGNAKDIFNKFVDNRFYKKVLNTAINVPQQGDILFFKTSYWFPFLYGTAGHVGIVDSAGLYNIILFNQNYPTGKYCELRKFTYKDCLGWLTPR